MNTPEIDNVSAGYIVAYDARTGDVLWTHEKIVEMIRGCEQRPNPITKTESEQIRAKAAEVFPHREVKAMIAPEGFALRENVRISVDPLKEILCEITDEPRSLAYRFAAFR